MLKPGVDLGQPQNYVIYARMSSDSQNPRSPDQQIEQVQALVARLQLPWRLVRTYRDDAISGRYVYRRLAFRQMTTELANSIVPCKLIAVDTFERFGRSEAMATIRDSLFHRHGILVVTADSGFSDPTSISGKVLNVVEAIRASEHNRIKGLEVLRGKRDAVQRGHWPGGSPPFGYKLSPVLMETKGRTEVDHHVLVPDPATAWIIQLIFAAAYERGWGQSRIAAMLNGHPNIPEERKPFQPATIGYWLQLETYTGTFVWEKVSTGIVNDVRVCQRNADEDQLRVQNFCEPIVDAQIAHAVREQRKARGQCVRKGRTAKPEFTTSMPGLALKYLLTGLVRCGHCGRAMTACSSSEYTTAAGKKRRYVVYKCVDAKAIGCSNTTSVPEDWLRMTVVNLLRDRLFPGLAF